MILHTQLKKGLFVFVPTAFTLLALFTAKLYIDQQELRRALSLKQSDFVPSKEIKVVEKIVSNEGFSWREVQSKFKNTVVQVFSQIAEVDLLEPYRTPSQQQGVGSAFFINNEGELVTNAHVVNQAKAIWIQIPGLGKQQIDVEILGLSFERDIALLKVKPEGLQVIKNELGDVPFLNLGDSDVVSRAEEIMTLGYPLGQQGLKSTVGVVSGREQHFIQIDAPINPGNSGGPSVNTNGEVVGINSMLAVNSQNCGYIIPINELKIILDDLRKVKLLKKPYLGILYINASDTLTQYLGNPLPGGVYVVDVYTGSPLQKAGIAKKDMIYEINGHRLDVYGEMEWNGEKISIVDYVSQLKLGQDVHLVVYSSGVRKDINFRFEQTDPLPIKRLYAGYETIDYEIIAGMVVQSLTTNHLPLLVNHAPSLAKYIEMKNQMEPVLVVTHIFPDSQAQRSRALLPGVTLHEVNGTKVTTLDQLREAVGKSLESDSLTIETGEGLFFVFPFEKVMKDEIRLSQDYYYPLTYNSRKILAKLGHDVSGNQPGANFQPFLNMGQLVMNNQSGETISS